MTDVNPGEFLIFNVDDYVPGLYARSRLLRQAGFSVVEATLGADVPRLAEEQKPALILLDVNLPDINGFEVCRQLRKNPATAGITVLHISASATLSQHQVDGLDSGADGYFIEPLEGPVLLATVNAFLRARKAEEALRKSHEELRWFSFRVGHDMAEPLRTITAYSQLLKMRLGAADPEGDTARLLDFITQGAGRIRSFMDGLLEYSQASAGTEEAKPVQCEAILDRVLASLDPAIRDSGAKITHDALPEVMAGEQLECVFENLIANAIKYARPGVAPEIHIGVRREAKAWVFSVKDNGIGIDSAYQEKVFVIFQRLHGQSIPGNGIGLALARRIVEGFGGQIQLESEVNSGSVFYVTLPAEPKTVEMPTIVRGAGGGNRN